MSRFLPMLTAAVLSGAAVGSAAPAPVLPGDYVTGSFALYRSLFMTSDGRIVDKENGGISHSEGQGYGMLMAVAANDRAAFDDLWAWTKRELFLREDGLAAWKWDPSATPHVADRNNATDGDLLIAWALLRAGHRWEAPDLRDAALALADAIAEHAVLHTDEGAMLLPGVDGFAEGRPGAPVVNLSYWVMPAIAELAAASPNFADLHLEASGARLAARLAEAGYPLAPDWAALGGEAIGPADGFEPLSGYNAVRVPLYFAWASRDNAAIVAPYAKAYSAPKPNDGPAVFRLSPDEAVPVEPMLDPGYQALVDALVCSLGEQAKAPATAAFAPTTYYASTLHILSQMALSERYPQCL
ncbi:glycosyl hydrolase family 8 [Antarcticirhabdus aurantiaca]|uniref:Glycosyl hydrolase family 8 n=1 Tax=Antarcticirhabdus aurantiaca TaxID=2606717 RepID=A0ACD4NIK2_9HYPH|nr:glycosyl hydrolase family 8 [Antarcticirhabdus aurantiaca]WAJ26599.1 glycosyl hydrolase family 8 [Jeongeuplla avenae]